MQRNVDRCIHWYLGWRGDRDPVEPEMGLLAYVGALIAEATTEYQEPVIKPCPENE
jgi:hypothetical protein